eukprot:gnl/TRDRNA2_/TRDRNA2_164881_c0_seq1.p1 gnl/TRDRNA2_/TRDRNA2_164881_c0~~gnl/TRDRNA2_/TRDRNA2_164881_c0_seq1.p1  ORF type:complete len:597 (-),score=94.04 gnl/TRDRNA2_/TRDRNA2_164881_c0_seq1:58-1824(-)
MAAELVVSLHWQQQVVLNYIDGPNAERVLTTPEKVTGEEVMDLLRFVEGFVGREDILDFASSSRWGPVSGALTTILNHIIEGGSIGLVTMLDKFGSGAQRNGILLGTPVIGDRQSALQLSRLAQPCDPILHEGCWRANAPPASHHTSKRTVFITVVGDHWPLSKCAALTAQVAAAELGIELQFAYAGQYYICQDGSPACEEDATKAFLRSMLSRVDGDFTGTPAVEADAWHDALRLHPHRQADSPDAFICLNVAMHCWLLRRRTTDRIRLGRIPTLHVFGMGFLSGVPPSWRMEILADFRSWWESRDPSIDIFSSYMEMLSLQMQWQMGVSVPFVPSVGLAFRTGASYDPPEGGDRSVVVLRSAFWHLPAGRTFSSMLERFAAVNSKTHRTRFLWLGSYTTVPLEHEQPRQVGAWHSFESMAHHTCALDVPAELSQIKFRDIYGMGLPLLVPSDQWMRGMLVHMFRGWGQMHAEVGDRLESTSHSEFATATQAMAAQAADWPHKPFYDPTRDPPARLEYWFPLMDHMRYPHTVRFESIPAVLILVADDGALAKTSFRMRAHFRRVVANTESFYKQSLAALLLPSPGAE